MKPTAYSLPDIAVISFLHEWNDITLRCQKLRGMQTYHPCMAYIPDDISQIPANHPGYIPASDDERQRMTILLHKRLDQIIDQEQQTGLSRHDRERLATTHQQIRADLAAIRYGATERTVREIERRYRAGR